MYKDRKYMRIRIAMKAQKIPLNALAKRISQRLRLQKIVSHISFSRKIILKLLIFLAWMNGKPCSLWILGKGQHLFSNQAVQINRYGPWYEPKPMKTLSYGLYMPMIWFVCYRRQYYFSSYLNEVKILSTKLRINLFLTVGKF